MFPIKAKIGYVGRNIRVGTVLKEEGLNCKKKKCHGNLDSVTFQQKSHENVNQKINFEITRNNRNITFIIKN